MINNFQLLSSVTDSPESRKFCYLLSRNILQRMDTFALFLIIGDLAIAKEAGDLLSPYEQMRDIRNAITYMASRGEVNAERIGLWGTSFGGTNAIYAASLDARIKCLTVQIAFADGDRVITGNMTEDERNSFIKSLHKQWKKKVLQNKVLALSPKNILADQQSQDFLDGVLEEFPKADIKIPILTMLHTIEFKPEIYIKSLEIPVLIVGAENDTVNPVKESEILFEKANEPKEILIVKDATHYEIYKPPFFEIVSEKQLAWFNKYL